MPFMFNGPERPTVPAKKLKDYILHPGDTFVSVDEPALYIIITESKEVIALRRQDGRLVPEGPFNVSGFIGAYEPITFQVSVNHV